MANTTEPIRDFSKIELIKHNLLKDRQYRNWLLFCFGLNSALRISDLLRLKISDCYEENMKPKERICLRERKTGKEKWLNIQNGSLEALNKYRQLKDLQYSDNFLFASRKGKGAISRVQAFKIIKDAGKQAGVKDIISCHSLRKTWGFMAFTKFGLSLDAIMLKLNHNSLSATKRYIGLDSDMLREIESKVSF